MSILKELREFSEIVDGQSASNKKNATTEQELSTALQALLFHQCLYSDHPRNGKLYDITLKHRSFMEKYIAAIGCEMIVSRRDGMVAIRPIQKTSRDDDIAIYGRNETRFKKDETLIFLTLRYLFEDHTRRREMDESGRIEVDTNVIFDTYQTLAKAEPPTEFRLNEILKIAKRKGLVRILERDPIEHINPVQILPGIQILISNAYVEAVISWIEIGDTNSKVDFFDHLREPNPNLSVEAENHQHANPKEQQDIQEVSEYKGDEYV